MPGAGVAQAVQFGDRPAGNAPLPFGSEPFERFLHPLECRQVTCLPDRAQRPHRPGRLFQARRPAGQFERLDRRHPRPRQPGQALFPHFVAIVVEAGDPPRQHLRIDRWGGRSCGRGQLGAGQFGSRGTVGVELAGVERRPGRGGGNRLLGQRMRRKPATGHRQQPDHRHRSNSPTDPHATPRGDCVNHSSRFYRDRPFAHRCPARWTSPVAPSGPFHNLPVQFVTARRPSRWSPRTSPHISTTTDPTMAIALSTDRPIRSNTPPGEPFGPTPGEGEAGRVPHASLRVASRGAAVRFASLRRLVTR